MIGRKTAHGNQPVNGSNKTSNCTNDVSQYFALVNSKGLDCGFLGVIVLLTWI